MIRRALGPLTAILVAAAAAHAQIGATATVPLGADVPYTAGGIGFDEMQQLKEREKNFNLKLVFTLIEGNYVSDVQIVVSDATGKSLLVLDAPGPVMLAKLARGTYVVRATYEGAAQTRKITVGDRLRTEYLRWPSNPETDFPGPKATE